MTKSELAERTAHDQALELAIAVLLRHSPTALRALKSIAERGVPDAPGLSPKIAKFMVSDRVTAHLDPILFLADTD